MHCTRTYNTCTYKLYIQHLYPASFRNGHLHRHFYTSWSKCWSKGEGERGRQRERGRVRRGRRLVVPIAAATTTATTTTITTCTNHLLTLLIIIIQTPCNIIRHTAHHPHIHSYTYIKYLCSFTYTQIPILKSLYTLYLPHNLL